MENPCSPSLDDTWGPVVDVCRRPFDFTLIFEESILSLLPAGVFFLLALGRIWQLLGREQKAAGGVIVVAKQSIIASLCALQLALIVLWSQDSTDRTRATLPVVAILFVVYLLLAPLSWYEHSTTLRPSPLICSYLLLSTILDLAQVRTLWLMDVGHKIPAVFSALFAVKGLLLIVECLQKKLIRPVDVARSPEDKCSPVSRSFFLWLVPLIYVGFRRAIKMDDMYEPPLDAAPEILEKKLQKAWAESNPHNKHRLLLVTAKVLKSRLLAPVIPRICMVGLMITQPVLLLRLINFLDEQPVSPNNGYGLLGAYALVYFGIAIANAWYFHQTFKFITAVRAGLVSLVYENTTQLNISSIDKASALTVMSADIERIVVGLRSIHDIWANVIQVALAAWLLERQTGVAIVFPVVAAAGCGFAALKISEAAGTSQEKWLANIEKRISITSHTLSSMRGVKMSGLADKLGDILQNLRIVELKTAAVYRWWELAAMTAGFFPVMVSPVITFAIFIAVANANSQSLDAARMFSSLSFLTLMSQPLSMLFQSGPNISSMVTCFGRISKFMETKKWVDPRTHTEGDEKNHDIKIIGGSFQWNENSKSVLRNMDVTFPQGKLTMIIGPVGCGKSTLLKGLLGEVPITDGVTSVPSDGIAFCDQTPWLMNDTFKQNVIVHSDTDDEFYNTVLEACNLHSDLSQFPEGDQANVGSKGITLSGGQKQRLSLARALFARRNINVFDDILSGLDSTTEMRVFARVFGPDGLLRHNGSTTVLATHAVHLLPFADHVVCIGPEGEVVQQGTFSELNSTDGYVRGLNIQPTQHLPDSISEADSSQASTMIKEAIAETTTERAAKPKGVYRYYIKAIGRWMAVIYVVLVTIYAFLYDFPYIWAKFWTDENAVHPGGRAGYYLGIYALLQIMCLIMLVVFAWHAVIVIVQSSGNKLHWALLSTALRAPLSFFEKTDTGVTLNRFSQDLQLVDYELPEAALNFFCSGLIGLGQLLLIMNTSYWLALSFPAFFLVILALQVIYLRTSRQLRHFDLENKAPLYSQFVETLDGLASIRAFNWQRKLKAVLHERLENSQRPFYLLLCLQRWLNLVLDCVVAGFILLLIGVIIGLRHKTSSGFAGVALSNMISLSMIMTNVVEVWVEMETSIAAIQRIRDFERDVLPETEGLDLIDVPENWPDKGAIEIRNLVATYREGTTTALKDFSMNIKPGEKIGVCGRTGSGKTSLMLSLFRMINIEGGHIKIDGHDIATVDPNTLRAGLNAIPQEPYFLSGSIRLNADPYGKRSDEEILAALNSVHIGKVIEGKGGLDAEMEDGTLSQGEKQLFCLARAILKRSRVVILDEATSNIDIETEKLIREVIREVFKDFTVITIAHRLESILSSDRIAVLEAGMLVEFDNPDVLLGGDSRFKTLYDTYKKSEAA
ncbi:ABC transporter FUM19 [Lachnellula suecica]|uniref:ABC transporter FUM19 n=1 Tax=Lachnellula suecica TaxID=602035 RepID=A0A8T9CGF8_9HELO|nr:ABC transporter FUM19 [Lachnellula suecica]